MTSWSNGESFDRDMPIKFQPIKWEKMLLKFEAAEAAEMTMTGRRGAEPRGRPAPSDLPPL